MFNRCLVGVAISFCLFIFTKSAQAQHPQISTGLGYLTSSQSPSGNWDGSTSQVETTAATVTALETLKLLDQTASASYSAGISWLQTQSPQAVAYTAKRALALDLNNGSGNALLPALDALRGGWGGYDGYAVNTLDTAYALQALQASGPGDFSTINA